MAHYALINPENIVYDVITGVNENNTSNLPSEFSSWEEFYKEETGAHLCKRTSYNTSCNAHVNGGTPFRTNYAGIGDIYDETDDVFYSPKPSDNHVLNTDTYQWELEE